MRIFSLSLFCCVVLTSAISMAEQKTPESEQKKCEDVVGNIKSMTLHEAVQKADAMETREDRNRVLVEYYWSVERELVLDDVLVLAHATVTHEIHNYLLMKHYQKYRFNHGPAWVVKLAENMTSILDRNWVLENYAWRRAHVLSVNDLTQLADAARKNGRKRLLSLIHRLHLHDHRHQNHDHPRFPQEP